MTAKEKQGFGLYFLFAFGLAWLCQIGGCMALLRDGNATIYQALLVVCMLCPLAATLLVQKVWLRQPTGIGWKVQGKRWFWLAAWFGPAVLTLLGGVVWGIWHWPLMLLVGYEYGTNYLGAPLLGLVVWCVVCFALNTLLDILYEKTESIWVPAIAHGAFNAIAALPQVLVTPADAYYNVLGPMPIGLIAALPMLAAAVWLTLREMKQEEKN